MTSSGVTESTVEASRPHGPSLFRSFSIIAVVTVISKVLGLVRDQMIAHAYGAAMVSDAYLYAFQIPSFSLVLLGGLGGPFHTATVSVLSKRIRTDVPPSPQALTVTNTFLTLTGLAFAGLSLAVFFWAPQVIDLIARQASTPLKHLAAIHLQWMSPMILVGGLIGIFYGVANVYHRFLWPSLSPSAINITLILWLLFWGPDAMGYALAVSTMLGALLQLACQLPDFYQAGFRWFPAFAWRDPDLKAMGELLFPAMIGTTMGQLNIYVAMFFVSQLEPGGWTATMLGNRLIQLPIGVLIIAMLVPLFPRFSRWVADGDVEALKESFREGILTLWLLSLPMVVLILLVGESAVSLLFERGAFTPEDTHMVTTVLVVLSLSILPYMLRDGLTRVFYAFNDSRTPLWAGLLSIGVNALFNALLVGPYGIGGIAFSTVIVTVCNALVLAILLRRHVRGMGLYRLGPASWRMGVAAAVSGVAGWGILQGVAFLPMPHASWVQALAHMTSATVTVGLVYLGMLLLLRDPLAGKLLKRIRSR